MAKTLGGITWVYNAIQQDYPIVEAANCLKELCDKVIILDAGSNDGTYDIIKSLEDDKTKIVRCSNSEWHKHQGREKLSFFQNFAAAFLITDYYFCLQSDEIIHEKSFEVIRRAIETGNEGYLISRINLWGDSQHQLNVPQDRKPVSTEIVRLAKQYCRSVDDGESIAVQDLNIHFLNDIRVYHMGFVRDNVKHLVKIRHIQEDVFQIECDKRIEGMTKFYPWVAFNREDVIPIKEDLPKFITQWAKERDEKNR